MRTGRHSYFIYTEVSSIPAYMESTGSFQYCWEVLSGLMEQARGHVDELEILLGPNQGIHRILDLLQVYPLNVNPSA
jgi:hypothetical protein